VILRKKRAYLKIGFLEQFSAKNIFEIVFNTRILVELDELYLTMYENKQKKINSTFELRAPYLFWLKFKLTWQSCISHNPDMGRLIF
jgi:hypothetical protein